MSTGFKTQDARRWHAKEMNRLFEARNIVLVFIFLVSTNAVAANGAGQTPQDAVQPTSERLDLGMYLAHSYRGVAAFADHGLCKRLV
jgi:hypothetical protein